MMAANTLHLVSDVLCRGVGTTILLPRCVGWCEMGWVGTRIDAALMAALQALTDVQDDLDAEPELIARVDLVKRVLVQMLEDRRRRREGLLN